MAADGGAKRRAREDDRLFRRASRAQLDRDCKADRRERRSATHQARTPSLSRARARTAQPPEKRHEAQPIILSGGRPRAAARFGGSLGGRSSCLAYARNPILIA